MRKLTESQTKNLKGGFGFTCWNCSYKANSISKNVLIVMGYYHEKAYGHSVHYWW